MARESASTLTTFDHGTNSAEKARLTVIPSRPIARPGEAMTFARQ